MVRVGIEGSVRGALLLAASPFALGLVAVASPAHAQQEQATPSAEPSPAGPAGDAAQTGETEEDIVITGIRASQARSIEVKRNADSVVEAISAQDIGKLPDVTISDSLQRIPGVQIRRTAGEGGAVNIRGLPQVSTLLNGEQFLGASSVTSVQPNFTDIPSQLFAGATVFKSPTASLQQAGLSGTIDLLTRRPLDLKRGLTVSAAVEGQYGDKTKDWGPSANGLVSYNSGRFGALLSAAYNKVTLANGFRGLQDSGTGLRTEYGRDAVRNANGSISAAVPGDFAVGNNGVSRGVPVRNSAGVLLGYDLNGDGDANDAYLAPQSHTAWDRETERARLGISGSLQFEFSDTLRLTADGFYTKQTQYERTAGFQIQPLTSQTASFVPLKSRDTGATITQNVDVGGGVMQARTFNFNTVQDYLYDLSSLNSYSDLQRTKNESQNYNLQLDWTPSRNFKATLRGVYGKASRKLDRSYAQFALANGTNWGYNGVGNYPASIGGDVAFNPTGFVPYQPKVGIDYSSGAPQFTFSQALLDQIADKSRYGWKTISSEGNQYQSGDIFTVRGDAEWSPSDALKVAFGGRYSERSVEQFEFERVVPLYAGNTDNPQNPAAGCLVKWKAFDVNLSDSRCRVLDAQGVAYTAGYARRGNDPIFNNILKQYALPAAGSPAFWVIDPKAMDDPQKFQDSFYPGNVNNVNPGASYSINLKQISGYVQVSGEGEVLGMPVRANGGVRIVNTKFDVLQNIVGLPQPYGLSGMDAGDLITKRDFTDILPAFNVALDVTEKLRARAAYSKTMTLLDLVQWGGALTVVYALNTDVTPNRREAQSASSTGNPQLDPWRADNVEASIEYYTGRSSLIAAGAFYIAVDSFIASASIARDDVPDNDGVVRRLVPVRTNVQGVGGTLKGIEVSARQSLADYGVGGIIGGLGLDANYTLSVGDAGLVDLAGENQPFQDNSRHQVNAALWFEKYGLQARVAYNYRSKRLVSSNYSSIVGLAQYQAPTNYVDASISYDILPNLTIYGQASNLTGETERYYLTFKDQIFNENIYERRFITGVRVRF